MPVYLYKMPLWELELLGVTLPASQIAAGEELERQQREEGARREAERLARRGRRIKEWPELYTPEQGGSAGDTVDLAPLWERAEDARDARSGDDACVDLLEVLAEDGGGLARRLRAGLQSMAQRRDGNITLTEEVHGQVITVTLWSEGGTWSSRSWWARTKIFVGRDGYGEVRLAAPRAEVIVGSEAGEVTRFADRGARHCVLGEEIVRAYRGWLARAAIRERLLDHPDLEEPPVTADEFVHAVQTTAS